MCTVHGVLRALGASARPRYRQSDITIRLNDLKISEGTLGGFGRRATLNLNDALKLRLFAGPSKVVYEPMKKAAYPGCCKSTQNAHAGKETPP